SAYQAYSQVQSDLHQAYRTKVVILHRHADTIDYQASDMIDWVAKQEVGWISPRLDRGLIDA
ncbi:MAG: hypothetical protein DRQ44_15815, partial [Gammaproteobacteria bacterium]